MDIKDKDLLEKAKLEDTIIDLLYSEYKDLVFHGGTAIWRCYAGNRFSRDVDFYLKASNKDRSGEYKEFTEFLKGRGFVVKEKGYGNSSDTMHFLVEAGGKMKIDINFKYKKGVAVEYVRVDGSKIIILSLTSQQLLDEKIEAYANKLQSKDEEKHSEVQDLYDIYYLTSIVKRKDRKTVDRLAALIKEIKSSPPPNVRSLGHLILSGLPPAFEMMVERIEEWVR